MTVEVVNHYPTWFAIGMTVAWSLLGMAAVAVIVWVCWTWHKDFGK